MTPGTKSKKDAVFVVLPSGFVSGILRVKAKHETKALSCVHDLEGGGPAVAAATPQHR